MCLSPKADADIAVAQGAERNMEEGPQNSKELLLIHFSSYDYTTRNPD